jgi:ATP-dependent Clp protease ATP-binding subunit ClpA
LTVLFFPVSLHRQHVFLPVTQHLGHAYSGTEHLLLGLIRSENIAGDVLRELGVDLPRTRSAVEFVVGTAKARPIIC